MGCLGRFKANGANFNPETPCETEGVHTFSSQKRIQKSRKFEKTHQKMYAVHLIIYILKYFLATEAFI